MISKILFAHCASFKTVLLGKCKLFGLFYMAETTEQAVNAPFLTRLVLVTTKLFTTHGTPNDLSLTKNMQAKLLCIPTDTKMYFLSFVDAKGD